MNDPIASIDGCPCAIRIIRNHNNGCEGGEGSDSDESLGTTPLLPGKQGRYKEISSDGHSNLKNRSRGPFCAVFPFASSSHLISPFLIPCYVYPHGKESITFAIYASFCFFFSFLFPLSSSFALILSFFSLFSFCLFIFLVCSRPYPFLYSSLLSISLSPLHSSILITFPLLLYFPSPIPSYQLRIAHKNRNVVRVCRVPVQLCLQQTRDFAPTRPAPAAPPLKPHQTHPPRSPTN